MCTTAAATIKLRGKALRPPAPTGGHGYELFAIDAVDNGVTVNAAAGLKAKLMSVEKMVGKPGMLWTGMDHPQLAFGQQDPIERWSGRITAADAQSGEIRWKVRTPKPMVAAIAPTAGGLVFTGDLDGNVLALDAQSGKELWRSATGKAIGGGVTSYDAGGKQLYLLQARCEIFPYPVIELPCIQQSAPTPSA